MRFLIATVPILLVAGCVLLIRPAFAQPPAGIHFMRQTIEDLQRQRDQYLEEFGRNHPKVQASEKQIQRLEKDLAELAKKQSAVDAPQRQEVEALKDRVAIMEQRLERMESLFEKLTETLPAPQTQSVSAKTDP